MTMRVVCSNPEFHNADGGFRWVLPSVREHADAAREQLALLAWQAKVREHRDHRCAGTSPFVRATACPVPRQLPRSA